MKARQTLVQLFADAKSGVAQEMEIQAGKVMLERSFEQAFTSDKLKDRLRVPLYFELHKELSYLVGQKKIEEWRVELLRQKIAMIACFSVLDSEARVDQAIKDALKKIINKDGCLVPTVMQINIGGDAKDEKSITEAANFTRDKLILGFAHAILMLLIQEANVAEIQKEQQRRMKAEAKVEEKLTITMQESVEIDVRTKVLKSLNISSFLDKAIENHRNKFRKLVDLSREHKYVIKSVTNDELFMASTTFDEYMKYKTLAAIPLSSSGTNEAYHTIVDSPVFRTAPTLKIYYQRYTQDVIAKLQIELKKQESLITGSSKRDKLWEAVTIQQKIILTEMNKLVKDEKPDVDEMKRAINEVSALISRAVGGTLNRMFQKSAQQLALQNLEEQTKILRWITFSVLQILQMPPGEILKMNFPPSGGVVARPRTPTA